MLPIWFKALICFLPLASLAWNFTVLQTLLLSSAILVLGFIINDGREEKYRLPPGPKGLPIVGSLPSMLYYGDVSYLLNLKQRYGSIIFVRLGSLRNIIINDYDTMKEISNNIQFQGRPIDDSFHTLSEGYGISNSEGKLWKHQRRFMLHSLRDSGMGKIRMEEKISNQVEALTDEIAKWNEKPMVLDTLLRKTTSNVIMSLACNKSFAFDSPFLNSILDQFEETNRLFSKLTLPLLIGSLKIFIKSFLKELQKQTDSLMEKTGRFIPEHEETLDEDNPRDYIDLFLIEKKAERDPENEEYQNTFTEKQLKTVIFDLFAAGTETSGLTIRWAILYMINYPEIQKKVQKEIDDVTGGNRAPTVADKPNLPFTMATLQEVERMATIIPLGLPKSNPAPAKFREYFFPERCNFMFNMYAVLRDPKHWDRPEEFMPERFINSEGNVFRPPHLITFGIGKRSCAGESLARMEIYLMFATLLQKFTFLPPDGKVPAVSAKPMLFRRPTDFKVVAKLRN